MSRPCRDQSAVRLILYFTPEEGSAVLSILVARDMRSIISFIFLFLGRPHTTSAFPFPLQPQSSRPAKTVELQGWLRDFFEPPSSSSSLSREVQYPEQYPATYELNEVVVDGDDALEEAKIVRPLLKNTQLESRPLDLVYDANKNGWNPKAFHSAVDGKGAAIVLAKTESGLICGGYNPKGWASLGGARPSVAAFLYYKTSIGTFQKLQKVGGGGLACARDDGDFGISFGPDGLVIPLREGDERRASSKLGPYFEKGPKGELSSLFRGVTELIELKVLVGIYKADEDIPYSGGVLDMTSG